MIDDGTANKLKFKLNANSDPVYTINTNGTYSSTGYSVTKQGDKFILTPSTTGSSVTITTNLAKIAPNDYDHQFEEVTMTSGHKLLTVNHYNYSYPFYEILQTGISATN